MRVGTSMVYVIVFFFLVTGCSAEPKERKEVELTISAAASLRDALTEVEDVYEQEKNINLLLNFASTGTLTKQIQQGAPVDVFLSADEENFKQLIDSGHINEEESIHLLSNELILIAPVQSQLTKLKDLNDSDRLAIGITETVPAGKYAKQVLEQLGLWDNLKEQIVYAKDVRQVLSYVETGNVSAGIVYKTDTFLTDRVKTLELFDKSLHEPILYPAGVVSSSKYKEEANNFVTYLKTEKVKHIFEKYGFNIID